MKHPILRKLHPRKFIKNPRLILVYGATACRVAIHRARRRQIHIAILDITDRGPKSGSLNAFWINARSRICSASLNRSVKVADVIWINTQDPISDLERMRLLKMLESRKKSAKTINHPDHYNFYHRDDAFRVLHNAGVSVPRSSFTEEDIGLSSSLIPPVKTGSIIGVVAT